MTKQARPVSISDAPIVEPMLPAKVTMQIVNKSRSQFYRDIRDGTFPRPVRIGKRKTAFIAAEVRAWIAAQPRTSIKNAA